jgi:hypothetical protein
MTRETHINGLGGRSGRTKRDKVKTDTVDNHRRVKRETVLKDNMTQFFFTSSGGAQSAAATQHQLCSSTSSSRANQQGQSNMAHHGMKSTLLESAKTDRSKQRMKEADGREATARTTGSWPRSGGHGSGLRWRAPAAPGEVLDDHEEQQIGQRGRLPLEPSSSSTDQKQM